jgi:NADH:ubiquinone oxidoreductase subunit F (NADH-binding)/(2Fe-2S) ferredoxin
MSFYRSHVMVCGGTGCTSSGCLKVQEALTAALAKEGLEQEVSVVQTGCFGFCRLGPIVIIYPEGAFYTQVRPDDIPEIVTEHLIKGKIVERLLFKGNMEEKPTALYGDIDFYKKQHRIALRNCGAINPEIIGEYIAVDGYQALAKALHTMTPEQVIETVKSSGIRGRGGAGFLTGVKWEFTAKASSEKKYVLCNADEGDPGAFMDRSVLEGDPHTVLEAMTIAGYAVGAQQGYIYVRAEYPIAVERLRVAIAQAREENLLGKNIFGTDFTFDVDLRLGSGAFVCGEETALMESVEGKRGMPRPRPPFPAVKGLWGSPTLINNVETYANIPMIILKGADWFSKIGTERSKGTKVFALAGKINNTGLVEVPMGTTLREIVYDIGGGLPGGKAFKAAQTGGPSGGCIPAQYLDVPIDYDSLKEIGSMMGSGGLIVMDETSCMVDLARFFLEFTQDESCGKCTPCREGTKRMLEILVRITEGQGQPEDVALLEDLSATIRDASLCGLGQSASNPVLSTLKYFREEYEAHIYEKRCPAGVCQALLQYRIDADKCRGCGLCAKECPTGAITGERKHPFVLDASKCVKCGACVSKCPFKAISR